MSHPVLEQSELVLCSSRLWQRQCVLWVVRPIYRVLEIPRLSFCCQPIADGKNVLLTPLTKTLLIVIGAAQVLQMR